MDPSDLLTPFELAERLRDLARQDDVPREAIPALRGALAELDTALLGRLLTADPPEAGEDQLLTVAEAAARLGVSQDYLYRHHPRFPFTRRAGRKLLFSAAGIERHSSQKKPL